MSEIYIGGRQTGKTTLLIAESAKTGNTIAVATHRMAQYIEDMATEMGLVIPKPVTYEDILQNYRERKTKRYLADELQFLLYQLNIDGCTVDLGSVHCIHPNAHQSKFKIYDVSIIENLQRDWLSKDIQDLQQETFKSDQYNKLVRAMFNDSKGEKG